MSVPIDKFVGSGWDQLLALVMLGGMVWGAFRLWLRRGMDGHFVTHSDYGAMIAQMKADAARISDRLTNVERQVSSCASASDLKNVADHVNQMGMSIASVQATIAGVGDSIRKVEHMMAILVEHELGKET